jgi:Uncharacterized conserved protein (COG2071)
MECNRPKFTADLLARPPLSRWDVVTTLDHFAIVTYAIDPKRLRPYLHPRFEIEMFPSAEGEPKAWVSMVPFEDRDFRFQALPWMRFKFGQTNYRTYVIDRQSGERAVWFFGTSLDSRSVAIPRYRWKLPWHRGRIEFDCQYDAAAKRYERYRMTTKSTWAPVDLQLEDSGREVTELPGCDDLEAALVILTHPLSGVFYRRDGALGSYRIWHDRLRLSTGSCVRAEIGLFDRLGLVSFAEQAHPHSVLIQPETEFTIYLPPHRLAEEG